MGNEFEKCEHGYYKVDCDGDYFVRCYNDDKCPYKNVVRDCDGDYYSICNKY